jgi:hypothetical protein
VTRSPATTRDAHVAHLELVHHTVVTSRAETAARVVARGKERSLYFRRRRHFWFATFYVAKNISRGH